MAFAQDRGFLFDNAKRNAHLKDTLNLTPKVLKTGTTIVGVVYKDGVVLGCDTRATSGTLVADKNTVKIEPLADNIACAGAGTSADCSNVRAMIEAKLESQYLATGLQPRVVAAKTIAQQYLFQYQGHVSAYLLIGGADITGGHLYDIYANGSATKMPFISNGSGSLAAMSVLESGYKDNMNTEEAIELVASAIKAGIFNDLGSGSNVDITVITAKESKTYRNYRRYDAKAQVCKPIVVPLGRTETIGEMAKTLRVHVEVLNVE